MACDGAVACISESANIPVAVLPSTAWPSATMLLGHLNEQLVVVLIDALERDPAPRDESGVFVHRRELANYVLYELTTLEGPLLLTGISGSETE